MIAVLKQRALHRSKILEGQLRGIQKMIENDEYCMDILAQTLAVQKSLSSLNKLLLENHMRTHIAHDFAAADETRQQHAIDELLKLYELNNVRGK